MKRFIAKYNLEILTFLMFTIVTASAVFMTDISITRKIILVYMFLFTLHEWEENRFPGGFANLMEKLAGKKFDADSKELSHIPVSVLLLAITIIPFIFDNVIFLTLIPVFLGIFESIVHIAGIKLHKMPKPYTPGLITALCMLLTSAAVIYYFSANGMANGKDYLLGLLCMILCFAAMQRTILMINGIKYKDIAVIIKSKLGR